MGWHCHSAVMMASVPPYNPSMRMLIFVCLCIVLFMRMPVCLCIALFMRMPVCLCQYLPVYQICLSMHRIVYAYACLFMPIFVRYAYTRDKPSVNLSITSNSITADIHTSMNIIAHTVHTEQPKNDNDYANEYTWDDIMRVSDRKHGIFTIALTVFCCGTLVCMTVFYFMVWLRMRRRGALHD